MPEELGSIAGLGRSPGEGNGYPLSIVAWRIPWTLQSMRLQRVRHDWVTFTVTFFFPKRSHCKNDESYHQIRATSPAVFHQEQSWPLGASGHVWTHLVAAIWGMEMGVVRLASSGERPGMLLTIPLRTGVLPILQCTGVLPIPRCMGSAPHPAVHGECSPSYSAQERPPLVSPYCEGEKPCSVLPASAGSDLAAATYLIRGSSSVQ